jgi:hypothetical protein
VNYFLNKTGILATNIDADIKVSNNIQYGTLDVGYETKITIENITIFEANFPVIKDLLNNVCQKVCRLVRQRKSAAKNR